MISAREICEVALERLKDLRTPQHRIHAPEQFDETIFVPTLSRPNTWAVVFPISFHTKYDFPFHRDYLAPAIRSLAQRIAYSVPPSPFSHDLECPKGVDDSAVDSCAGWQMRVIIDWLPYDAPGTPAGGDCKMRDWYSISIDQLERRYCTRVCRIDVRAI